MSGGPGGLRAAGHALLYWQRRQEINAHNLANAETAGFQARRVFAEVLEGGVPSVGIRVDGRAGALTKTGAPLDLALAGEGSFVVRTAEGEEPVRSGSFSLDADGRVVDAAGNALLGVNGPLILPPGPVEIDARGTVTVAGEEVGRLRVVQGRLDGLGEVGRRFGLPGGDTSGDEGLAPPPVGDRAAAGSDVSAAAARSPGVRDMPGELGHVRQGFIEESNVSALDALIEMTTIQRSFEAVQTSVRTIDSVMETVSNRIGRVE